MPPVNDVDVFAQDLGFIAIVEDGELAGFNLTVGGGLGTTHGEPATYPRLADVVGFLRPGQLLAVAEAVVTTQRDFGDRTNRKHARLKYTIDDRGLDWFVAEITRRQGFALEPARPFEFTSSGDRFGWIEGYDGRWHLTLRIESGRVADTAAGAKLTGLREIARVHRGDFRLTANQNLIDRQRRGRGARSSSTRSSCATGSTRTPARRPCTATRSPASRCRPAASRWPRPSATCPGSSRQVEQRLGAHGLRDEPIVLRITGCPNGCARPYLAEIALIGKAPGRYNLYLGGDERGQRLNVLYRENIDEPTILAALDAAFARFAAERQPGERFGDFTWRAGLVQAAAAPEAAGVRALAWDPERAAHEPVLLDEVNLRLERMKAEERVRWALEHLPGGHALSSSFGAQAAVSLHLVTQRVAFDPGDPGRHGLPVPGDLPLRRRTRAEARPEPEGLPAVGVAGLARGAARPALGAGRRRHRALQRPAQERADAARAAASSASPAGLPACAATRPARAARIRPLECRDGRWKVHPIFDWTDRQVFQYLAQHDLPYHPLWHQGYVSIGDWHTTRTLAEAGDPEATRFFGLKRECGLHGLEG